MRLTVHIGDDLGARLKAMAANEGQSVSAFVASALETHLAEQRRRRAGGRVLEIAGRRPPAADALDILEQGRSDDRP